MQPAFDAIVLAGGQGSRLGGVDKAAVTVDGTTLLERVVTAAADAKRRIVVGPPHELNPNVIQCREDPPGGGPVAGLAAGLALTDARIVVVLAVDLPHIAPAIPVLLAALTEPIEVALLVDPDGRRNYLASAWRRDVLETAIITVGDTAGASMRSLYNNARVIEVPDTEGWGADIDTPADLDRARQHNR